MRERGKLRPLWNKVIAALPKKPDGIASKRYDSALPGRCAGVRKRPRRGDPVVLPTCRSRAGRLRENRPSALVEKPSLSVPLRPECPDEGPEFVPRPTDTAMNGAHVVVAHQTAIGWSTTRNYSAFVGSIGKTVTAPASAMSGHGPRVAESLPACLITPVLSSWCCGLCRNVID